MSPIGSSSLFTSQTSPLSLTNYILATRSLSLVYIKLSYTLRTFCTCFPSAWKALVQISWPTPSYHSGLSSGATFLITNYVVLPRLSSGLISPL